MTVFLKMIACSNYNFCLFVDLRRYPSGHPVLIVGQGMIIIQAAMRGLIFGHTMVPGITYLFMARGKVDTFT